MGKKERVVYTYRKNYSEDVQTKKEWEFLYAWRIEGNEYKRREKIEGWQPDSFFSEYVETRKVRAIPGLRGWKSVLRDQIGMAADTLSLIEEGKTEKVSEEDTKRLLGLKLAFDRTYLAESKSSAQTWLGILSDLRSAEPDIKEKYIKHLIDFQISQMQKLGAEYAEREKKAQNEDERLKNVTRYSETGYIALAEEMLDLIEPGLDKAAYMKQRLDERNYGDEEKKHISSGLQLLSREPKASVGNDPTDENIRKILWDLKMPVKDGEKFMVFSPDELFSSSYLKELGRKKSLIVYDDYRVLEYFQNQDDGNSELRRRVLFEFEDQSERCYRKDILSPDTCKETFKTILERNRITFKIRSNEFSQISRELEREVEINEQKKILDEMVGQQIRLDQGLMSPKEEQEFYGNRDDFFSKNKYIQEVMPHLTKQRTEAFAEVGRISQENQEKGESSKKTEEMRRPEIMKAQALEALFQRAKKAAPDLAEREMKAAETDEEKKTLSERGSRWMEELKKENRVIRPETDIKEKVQKQVEGLRSALGETEEWGKEGSEVYKKLYYKENQQAISDVAKQLSQTKKKNNAADSEYFTAMLEGLHAFEGEKENGRETAIRACETYIEKRKGTFFGPATDAGKERLALARAVLHYLKEPEEKKVLSREEVKKWDLNRSEERKAREEYQERIRRHEKTRQENLRHRQQKEWREAFEEIGDKAKIGKKQHYDLKWNSLLKGRDLPDDVNENVKLCKPVDEMMQEKYKELLPLKKSNLLDPSEEILFDTLHELKKYNDFNLCKRAYEAEEADRHLKERGFSFDYLWDDLRKYASVMEKGLEKMRKLELYDGKSPDSEKNMDFLMAPVRNLQMVYYNRTENQETPYDVMWERWNRREALDDLRAAADLVTRAENLVVPGRDEKMLSPLEKEQKRCYKNLTNALIRMRTNVYVGDEWEERQGLLDLRQSFDDIVHCTSGTDEKQRQALQNVMNAVGIVMQVYPNAKAILDLDQIEQENLKGALYFQDAMRKLEGREERDEKEEKEEGVPEVQKVETRKVVSWKMLVKEEEGMDKNQKQEISDRKKEPKKAVKKSGKEKSGQRK